MKRIVLAVLLLGLVTLLVPSLRERAQPRIDAGRVWLGEKLEGPMSPVLNPYRRLKAQSEIGRAVNELARRRNMGNPPPKPQEFRDFMAHRNDVPEGLDPWGAPYLLRQRPDSLDIISAGPDIQYETDDDIVVSMRYADPGRRLRRGSRR